MPERRQGLALVLRKTANRVRVRGPREVLGLGLERLRENLASDDELIFFARRSGGTTPEREDAFLREGRAGDAEPYAAGIGTESPATFRARQSDRTRCYLVVDPAGRILHSSWVTTEVAWTREIRRYVAPPSGAAYVHESFTAPAARGRGIYSFALQAICARVAGEIEAIWVAVEADNPASVRAVGKAGFDHAFRLPYRRRLGRLFMGEPEGPGAEVAQELLRGRRI